MNEKGIAFGFSWVNRSFPGKEVMEAGLLKGSFHYWGWRLPVPGGQKGGEAEEEGWVQSRPFCVGKGYS